MTRRAPAKEDSNDIVDIFQDYADAMNDVDAEGLADLFAFPVSIWQLGRGYIFEELGDLVENIEALLNAFDGAGVTYSEPEMGPVHVTNAAAFTTATWRQQDELGEIIHTFHCDYTLVHIHGSWMITHIINHEAVDKIS